MFSRKCLFLRSATQTSWLPLLLVGLVLGSAASCSSSPVGPSDVGEGPGPSPGDSGSGVDSGTTSPRDAGTSTLPPIDATGPGPLLQGERLTGVNWFGFETANLSPHGLWARDYHSMLKQIKDLGFNAVRLPWCSDMLTGTPTGLQVNAYGVDPYTHETGMNLDLEGLGSLAIMDKILEECRRIGLRVILDNHSRAHDGYMQETLWYHGDYTEEQWIADWKFVIDRYKDNPAVVAADLKNEPHGNMTTGMKPPATWGYDEAKYGHTDWRKAAVACGRAILATNPRIILIVEGVEQVGDDAYWWGGNLKGVKDHPITASELPAGRLWYSAHEYGPEVYAQPWFSAANFPENLPGIWNDHFWFIHANQVAPLFFGEFGIKEASAADSTSVAHRWLASFMAYVGNKSHWTFWAMNPNSGDTEGILKDDWVSVNTAKLAMIQPYMAPQFAGSP